jgi:hypothetical protein
MDQNVLKQTRIVRHGGKIGIHEVDVDPKTSQVVKVSPTPIMLQMNDDGTSTMHLELMNLMMDAIAAHRKAVITSNVGFSMKERV